MPSKYLVLKNTVLFIHLQCRKCIFVQKNVNTANAIFQRTKGLKGKQSCNSASSISLSVQCDVTSKFNFFAAEKLNRGKGLIKKSVLGWGISDC